MKNQKLDFSLEAISGLFKKKVISNSKMSATNRTDGRYASRVYSGIMPPYWDRLDIAYPSALIEDFAFSVKTPDSDDSAPVYQLMATLRIVYTDSSKALISTVTKTYKRPETD
jgi:hypothetical protein